MSEVHVDPTTTDHPTSALPGPSATTPGPTDRPVAALCERRRRLARRDLAIFFGLVVVLSAPWEIAISRTHALAETSGVLLVAPLMWMPALSALLTRRLTRQPLRGESRGRGFCTWRWLLLPLAVGVPAYAVAVMLGLVTLDPPAPWQLLVVLLVGLLANVVLVPGEEIGWRGFMLPRLVSAGLRFPLVTNGVIWAGWHVPLLLWGGFVLDGPPPWVSVLIFLLVLGPALGGVLGWLRLRTGSTWPPIALHVVWNTAFQAGFEVAVSGPREGVWVGELGLLTNAVLVAVLVVVILGGAAFRTARR